MIERPQQVASSGAKNTVEAQAGRAAIQSQRDCISQPRVGLPGQRGGGPTLGKRFRKVRHARVRAEPFALSFYNHTSGANASKRFTPQRMPR
jgi:hypothetical protein